MTIERCDVCGFVWDDVTVTEFVPRIRSGVSAIASLLRSTPDVAGERPCDGRWSMLEYGSHVRDVLLALRDRFVTGLVVDDPGFTPLFRDDRVDLGLYAGDHPQVVATELEMAGALLCRLLAKLNDEQWDRSCQYSFPEPTARTLRWMGAQVVHEVEHHLGDIRRDLVLVAD